jgi:CelD/BcsL family acetyltransferase involved in cellulose biosynthesis
MPPLPDLADYSTVHVFTHFEDARADWLALSQTAKISPYQSFEFLSAWFDAFGASEGVTPYLIVARDAADRPSALLPLCTIRKGAVTLAAFLGGREANFNLPLLRPDRRHDEAGLRWLMREAARRAPSPPDVLFLRNQPRQFEGARNPLLFMEARPSASFGYATALPETIEELTSRLSKETRKKLRKKEARLAELGPVAYEHQIAGQRGHELVTALLEQKSARFAAVGTTRRRSLSALLHGLLEAQEDGVLELHGLSVDGRFVAAYAGVRRNGRFSAMLNSFDTDEEIARCSPGDLLLHALMRNLTARRMTHFDLGVGEARYKRAVCDETIPLYDVVLPLSARGVLAAPLISSYLRLKRRAKNTPAVVRCYYRLVALLGR